MYQLAISDIVQKQRNFFNSGKTKDIPFRIQQLKLLKKAITKNEGAILKAAEFDMRKPATEAYFSEIVMVLNEIDYAIKHLKSWAEPKRVKTPLLHTHFLCFSQHFLASSYIYTEPLGVVLITGTWNYPFQFTVFPLVGAISAGNCVILKPSEISPHMPNIIARMIGENFDLNYISVIEGGVETAQTLLAERFDYIFSQVGRG